MNNCLLIKRREVETKCQLEQLRNEMAANRSLKEESESTVEQLKETIHQKDASVREIEDELKCKSDLLNIREQDLERKEAEVSSLAEKLKKTEELFEEKVRKLQTKHSEAKSKEESEGERWDF
ncbi:unnamed protein product [Heligmosomoides polygyrus]|uniref:Myosin_tail_1 domain-containing protein n=1 Tax=Heligmosomoides polygyrus TaxID=6339 RepID=A0A183GUK9_HELPZ|nr:unnamed protein product [Heligmosomoides polygyrus]